MPISIFVPKTRKFISKLNNKEKIAANELGNIGIPKFIFPLQSFHDIIYNRDNGLLSYYSKLGNEKQTDTSPNKYYIKMFSTLKTDQIVSSLKNMSNVVFLNSNESKHFSEVYNKYFPGNTCFRPGVAGSCMRHTCEDLHLPYHPTEVYATNENCRIAALVMDGLTIARCILNTKKNTRTKIYSGGITECDCSFSRALLAHIVDDHMGFARDDDCLLGLDFETEMYKKYYICPYIDEICRVSVNDIGNRAIVTPDHDGDFMCDSDGTIEEEERNRAECIQCGESVNIDDSIDVYGDCYCSNDCVESAGWLSCYRCGNYISENEALCSSYRNRTYCNESCARRDGYECCDNCGDLIDTDDFVVSSDNGRFCKNCSEECKTCGKWFEPSALMDGICEDCEAKNGEKASKEQE
jgi:hypothetical protein